MRILEEPLRIVSGYIEIVIVFVALIYTYIYIFKHAVVLARFLLGFGLVFEDKLKS